MYRSVIIAALITSLTLTHSATFAGDWPMWRYDAGRTAAAPDPLPANLQLLWTRQMPRAAPAWPDSQTRLRFDDVDEPVIAGKRLFIGSSSRDRVTAYSTETGEELWRFYADGPVRFAPIAHDNHIYFASDDGFLYCLSAAEGKLAWKLRGGPADKRVLGNDRLISAWPARGGPVLADGKIVFGASVWPFMGVFIHAVEPQTGRVVWTNSEMGSRWMVHPHGAPAFGSIVPQGYLAAAGDNLIVPGGRSTPAVFNLANGQLRHFEFDKKYGDSRVIAAGDFYFCSGQRYLLKSGKNVGSADPAVLAGNDMISSRFGDNTITAVNLQGAVKEVTKRDIFGRMTTTTEAEARELWRLETTDAEVSQVFAMAGTQIIVGGPGALAIYDSARRAREGVSEAVWSATVEGVPVSVAVADEKLFVVNASGLASCFGTKREGEAPAEPRIFTDARTPNGSAGASPSPAGRSQDLIAQHVATLLKGVAHAAEGYAVVLGIGNSRLIDELIAQAPAAHLIAIDADAALVNALRRRMDDAGLYGSRIAAHAADPAAVPLPPYLANLIICNVPVSLELIKARFDTLRPYGGAMAMLTAPAEHDAVAAQVISAKIAQAKVSRVGQWTVIQRAGPLPGSGDWTHQYGDAANTSISSDTIIKAPFGVLWFGGPSHDKILPRHGHGPNPQVAGGRLFIEGPHMLRAVDVYTGRLLWEKNLKNLGQYYNTTRHFPGAGEIGSNYVCLPDRVYVAYEGTILELDSDSGELVRQYKAPAENGSEPHFGFLAVSGDYLITTVEPVSMQRSGVSSLLTFLSGSRSDGPDAGSNQPALIPRDAKWLCLAYDDPEGDWTAIDFDAKGWSLVKSGTFGSGDDDDDSTARHANRDPRDKYDRVYIRREFDAADLGDVTALTLTADYDEGFIVYLNGNEIQRTKVKAGRGAKASGIGSRDHEGYESFTIRDFRKHVKPGKNVIAIEGHKPRGGSEDEGFNLDAYILLRKETPAAPKPPAVPAPVPGKSDDKPAAHGKYKESTLEDMLKPARYASASRHIVVFDRRTGRQLWSRQAGQCFRHNTIIAGGSKLFAVDSVSSVELKSLERQGVTWKAAPKLLALDLRDGREVWSTEQDVFGTFLSYSPQHDVLLQGGSANRDRARDEVSQGMIALQGQDGRVIWKDMGLKYNGPCLLWRDRIITNGSDGSQYSLLTGKKLPWGFKRMYGCNSIVGSENLLTFRSGAAGFYDLLSDSGTGNIGGFRSSCTSNLIIADGVLNAPDYTRTCTCSYQNQTSLALIHMPEMELWTFNAIKPAEGPIDRIGINFGAPGDRRSPEGTLWVEYPSVGGASPDPIVRVAGDESALPVICGLPGGAAGTGALAPTFCLPIAGDGPPRFFSHHLSRMEGDGLTWVGASGAEGVRSITITLDRKPAKPPAALRYTVKLYFAEMQGAAAGERVFHVNLQGRPVLRDCDIARDAGGKRCVVVKTFQHIAATNEISITFDGINGARPLISGVELIRE